MDVILHAVSSSLVKHLHTTRVRYTPYNNITIHNPHQQLHHRRICNQSAEISQQNQNPMSTRRKSTVSVARGARLLEESPALELERLEQETTLVLQEIDKNLSHANAVINDKMVPILRRYATATSQVWTNVGFWKHFLEEAADVEISTVNDPLDAGPAVENVAQTPPPAPEEAHARGSANNASSSSSEPHIEALTPQLRSRPLLLSSHSEVSPQVVAMRKTTAGYLKVAVSPRKRTPKRTLNRADVVSASKRLSVLQNFLNSSPTLPEPPVLLSEVGRMGAASSSSVNRPNLGVRQDLLSDSDERNLGALLPILFPSLSLTPAVTTASKRELGARLSSGQRFPRTPTFGSSAARKGNQISPVRRTPVPMRPEFEDDSDLPVPKPSTVLGAPDESDDLPLPDLQTIQVTGLKHGAGDVLTPKPATPGSATSSAKRRKLSNDDAENVFLESNSVHGATSRNNSTIYHTVVHDAEREVRTSRSMSQIFDEVLLNTAAEKTTSDKATSKPTNAPTIGESEIPHLAPAESGGDEAPILPAHIGNDSTQNFSQTLDDPTGNSSELGSFLGQRWRSLSNSLRKK